jgi:Fur family ferric uptake transcriptional regulator
MGAVSVQAVYDVLNTLTEHGLIRRIQPAGSVARYEVRVGDNHHHVVCRSCGITADIDCVKGEAPCLEPDVLPSGFVLDEAEVTYWGLCADCGPAAGQLQRIEQPDHHNHVTTNRRRSND